MLKISVGNVSICIKVLKMGISVEPTVPLVKNLEVNGGTSLVV